MNEIAFLFEILLPTELLATSGTLSQTSHRIVSLAIVEFVHGGRKYSKKINTIEKNSFLSLTLGS